MEPVSGIDVSRWQGEINWSRVAENGRRFAAIRATIGDYYTDPRFYMNWSGAREAGLLITAYHVITPNVSAQRQIDHFFNVLDGRVADFPLVVDVEREDGATTKEITACVRECLSEAEARDGRKPIIYTARWFWNRFVLASPLWKRYDLWVASYTSEPVMPRDWETWRFWQYSESGEVPGVASRATDLNWYAGTYEDLLAYAGQKPVAPPLGLQARIKVRKLNVRSGPGLNYQDIGDLFDGDLIDVLALAGDDVWFQIAPGQWAAYALDGERYMDVEWSPPNEGPNEGEDQEEDEVADQDS